jgi:hypothetical protein
METKKNIKNQGSKKLVLWEDKSDWPKEGGGKDPN